MILDDPRQRPERWQLPATRRLPHDAAGLVRQFYDLTSVQRPTRERAILTSSGGGGADDSDRYMLTTPSQPSPYRRRTKGPDAFRCRAGKACGFTGPALAESQRSSADRNKTLALSPEHIGMCSTHRVMNSELALALPRSLQGRVLVDTPERWQGLERPMMIFAPTNGSSSPNEL